MANTLLRRINRVRFDLPLAVLLGASAAFAAFAMPDGAFGLLLAPAAKAAVAAVAALVLGGAGFAAMKLAGAKAPAAIWEPDLDHDEAVVEEVEQEEPRERIRTRRADRHPDAPTREPIRASRDLGRPFMDVGSVLSLRPDEEVEEAEFVPWHAAPEQDEAEEEPATVWPLRAVSQDIAEIEAPIAAFTPAEEPAPQPARVGRQSIAAMMDRLSAGVERRGGRPPQGFSAARLSAAYGRPRTASADLRAALDELNRLASRRG